MVNVVKKGFVLELLPDDDMVGVLEQNMRNTRFIWNQLLSQYNRLRKQFQFHGYPLNANIRNFNMMLKMLKVEYPFLRDGESTSQQQVFRDLVQAFNRFLNMAMVILGLNPEEILNNLSGYKKTETTFVLQIKEYVWPNWVMYTTIPVMTTANS